MRDNLDLIVTGASPAALQLYERALAGFQTYSGDPVGLLDQALADSPAFVMAHALKAYLHLVGTDPGGVPVARAHEALAQQALDEGLPASGRERAHLAAVGHLAQGRWRDGARALEDIAIETPHDAVALQVGHLVDFLRGDARMLRDRIGRALPAWSPDLPGYHAVLGMQAFGLEEAGDYARAEEAGRRAVALEPRDGWAYHAVAHVLEMQGRVEDGIAWMTATPDDWSRDSFFAIHNWWHLALYHLELGSHDEVLRLYDGPIFGKPSEIAFDLVDASALLWRLHLLGQPLGERWHPVADAWDRIFDGIDYAFNDAHAMMAYVGAGRRDGMERVLANLERALRGDSDNREFAEVGLAVARGLQAFGDGDYRRSTELLRAVRPQATRFGGSHAQRDLIDLTLIEAALRGGDANLAGALIGERALARPNRESPIRLRARLA